MSEDPTNTPRSKDLSALNLNDAASGNTAADIDAYMAEQGDASGEATVSTADAPSITLNGGGVATTHSTPPPASSSPAEKLEYIRQLCATPLKAGDTWYLVSKRWYRRWEKACTGEEDKDGSVQEKDLGPVDNASLVDMRGKIVSTVIEHVDVEYVPEAAWQAFVNWYVIVLSIVQRDDLNKHASRYGTPLWPLPRKVVTRGILQEATIELHPQS